VCGTISANTTLTTAGNPYDVCAARLSVLQGATLTIDPGLAVTFEAGAGNQFLGGVAVEIPDPIP